jgi:hypothetical protein
MSQLISFQVKRAKQFLAQQGCRVLTVSQAKKRPVISIDAASPYMQSMAITINQTINGQRSQAFTAHVNGCLVHWHKN